MQENTVAAKYLQILRNLIFVSKNAFIYNKEGFFGSGVISMRSQDPDPYKIT